MNDAPVPSAGAAARRSLVPVALLALAAVAGCRASAPGSGTASPRASGGATVRFLLVNDVYVSDTMRDGRGGLARLATLRRTLAAEDASRGAPLAVLAGDVLSPSLLSKWYAGRQMVDAFNAVGIDYAAFGNHEFELDRDTLLARVRQSRFRWLSANCTIGDSAARGIPGAAEWDTVRVGPVLVGIFGTTLRGDYRRYVRCGDPAPAGRAAAAALRAAGADLVVALTHQNVADDSLLLASGPAIDLVLGGHEHGWQVVRTADGRAVVKADANARTAQLVTATRRVDGRGWTVTTRLDSLDGRIAHDPATARVVDAWRDTLARRLGPEREIAIAVRAVDGRDAQQRTGEGELGDIAADAMRSGTGADVALINGGTLRLDDMLGPGVITTHDLERIFLFADETRTVTFPLTGARLRAVIEHGLSDGVHGKGGFLQISGARFTYDLARASGARIVELRYADGREIGAGDALRVAFTGYPACAGGDGYVVPEAKAACAALASAPRTADLLIRHVTGPLGGRLEAPPPGRITRLRR